ncbi:hypothetical protein L484_024480 [Morus notabilis]|uniref:Uncharacterized protein n=1 Tax=Morus notabilis TaxID=981085 RepID=W9RHX6_9ROSA|nr:hypothetical protein L484_024480 [Morus notabilis]
MSILFTGQKICTPVRILLDKRDMLWKNLGMVQQSSKGISSHILLTMLNSVGGERIAYELFSDPDSGGFTYRRRCIGGQQGRCGPLWRHKQIFRSGSKGVSQKQKRSETEIGRKEKGSVRNGTDQKWWPPSQIGGGWCWSAGVKGLGVVRGGDDSLRVRSGLALPE